MNKKVNRNDPCPCGSGEKYKKCCEKRELARQQKRLSGLKGISAKPLTTNIMNGFAKKVFKVLSDTAPGPSHINKTVTQGEVEQKIEAAQQARGYKSLEELIGVEGTQEDNLPQSLPRV